MKFVFLTIWTLLFLPLGAFTLMAVCRNPGNYSSYLIFGGIAYVGFCSLRLIQESYRPRDLFASSNAGYFFSLGLGKNCTVCTLGLATLGFSAPSVTRVGSSFGTELPRSSRVSA